MLENIKDQIHLDNVKKFIKYYLEHLHKDGFTPFQEMPTVEVFPKSKNLIGLSLIDEKNSDIRCRFVDNPRQGDDYLFIPIDELKEDFLLKGLAESYAFRKSAQMAVDDAYSINLQRVTNLLNDKQFAVALVFLVSSFENITRDLFFLYSELWFSKDKNEYVDEVYNKVGIIIDPNISISFISDYFSTYKEINGQKIGIEKTKIIIAEKWENVRYWEKIHKICRSLGVYDEYILKKQGNIGMEIGCFEILKEILETKAKEMKILNFQKIFGKWGIVKLFKIFFNINLENFKETLKSLDIYIKNRHKIIHGTLKDDKINENMVIDFRSCILKVVSYLMDELTQKYRDNLHFFLK
ncbi:MAG: hypothetical protein ACFFG0_50860 [Candidatus Thorarchaeota archaeon]